MASAVVVAVVASLLVSLLVSGILVGRTPSIVDTDGFMRLVRASELRLGQVDWWDGFAYRSNAPFGHSMHWTRPLDALLLGVAWLVALFGGSVDSLEVAGMIVGPFVLGLLSAAIAWAAFPLVGRIGALVAGVGVALQPTLQAYGAVGRVDHHGLILLLAAVLLGCAFRLALDPYRLGPGIAAGVVSGIGLWVSVEFLLPIGLFLTCFLTAWVLRGAPFGLAMRAMAVAWLATTAIAVYVERGPIGFQSDDLDRISAIHVMLAALAAVFWVGVGLTIRNEGRRRNRLRVAAVVGFATGAALWLVAPDFASGPFGDVPPALWDAWLSKVAELQPLWPIGSNPVRTVYLMGAPLLGAGLGAIAIRTDESARPVWIGVVAAIAVLGSIGMFQARFSGFAQIVATVPLGWLSAYLVGRLSGTGPMVLKRVAAMLVGAAGFLLPTMLVTGLDARDSGPGISERCTVSEIARVVSEEGGERVVLAHVDFGPELLYRSYANVVASPYHRNIEGILDARRFLGSDEAAAAEIAHERRVDVVAVCPQRDAAYLDDDRQPGDLLERLVAGDAPEWLFPVPTTDDLLVFVVIDSAVQEAVTE